MVVKAAVVIVLVVLQLLVVYLWVVVLSASGPVVAERVEAQVAHGVEAHVCDRTLSLEHLV